jgi:hypothetical protein
MFVVATPPRQTFFRRLTPFAPSGPAPQNLLGFVLEAVQAALAERPPQYELRPFSKD